MKHNGSLQVFVTESNTMDQNYTTDGTTMNTTDVSTWMTNITDGSSEKDTTAEIRTGDIMKKIYIVIALVGLSGNAVVVITFGSFRRLRKKITNKYIINQVCLLIDKFIRFEFYNLFLAPKLRS